MRSPMTIYRPYQPTPEEQAMLDAIPKCAFCGGNLHGDEGKYCTKYGRECEKSEKHLKDHPECPFYRMWRDEI